MRSSIAQSFKSTMGKVISLVLLVTIALTFGANLASAHRSDSSGSLVNQHLMADLRQAETVLAQGMSNMDSMSKRYAAIMTASGVVPMMGMSDATAVGGAVLLGDRLVIRGDFGNLSSAFRDYGMDPASPLNPNITSGVHIHRGEVGKNGPFQHALTVMMNPDGKSGRFMGEYKLSSEQLQALEMGNLYMDMHTRQNRAGEVRGTFRPL